MLFRYDSALSGLFGRIVITEQLLQMTKYIPIQCPLLQPAQQEQGSKIKRASESYLESMQQEFYLTGQHQGAF